MGKTNIPRTKHLDAGDKQVLDMVTLALDKMMNGGIHDHLAGGFHRYSTDSVWLIPHYEKMLYDNAQLAVAYTEAWQMMGKEPYKQVSQKILDYLLTGQDLKKIILQVNQALYEERSNRNRPGRDDKIILSWNSLVISALAKAGVAFNLEKYITAAMHTHEFILKNLWQDETFFHSFKDNKRGHQGFLDDHAFLAAACIDLYEDTFDIQWLLKAMEVDAVMQKKFEDPALGGFFMTPLDQGDLIAREKPAEDGAIPSGNAIAVNTLVRLYRYTHQKQYQQRAEKAVNCFSSLLMTSPQSVSGMLSAILMLTEPARETEMLTPEDKKKMTHAFEQYHPEKDPLS